MNDEIKRLVTTILQLDRDLQQVMEANDLMFSEREEQALDIRCDLSDLAIDLALVLSGESS